jgi:hypothetical protein
MKLQKNNNRESIKHKNRAIKSKGTKSDKKFKYNKMPKEEIEKNPKFKKYEKPNKQ